MGRPKREDYIHFGMYSAISITYAKCSKRAMPTRICTTCLNNVTCPKCRQIMGQGRKQKNG